MNGLPVIAMAATSSRARAAFRALLYSVRLRGPRVFGLVWSSPLSRVINTAVRPVCGSTMSRLRKRVTRSSGVSAEASASRACSSSSGIRGLRSSALTCSSPSVCAASVWCGFSQMTVPPMPSPMHMVVMPYRISGCSRN